MAEGWLQGSVYVNGRKAHREGQKVFNDGWKNGKHHWNWRVVVLAMRLRAAEWIARRKSIIEWSHQAFDYPLSSVQHVWSQLFAVSLIVYLIQVLIDLTACGNRSKRAIIELENFSDEDSLETSSTSQMSRIITERVWNTHDRWRSYLRSQFEANKKTIYRVKWLIVVATELAGKCLEPVMDRTIIMSCTEVCLFSPWRLVRLDGRRDCCTAATASCHCLWSHHWW